MKNKLLIGLPLAAIGLVAAVTACSKDPPTLALLQIQQVTDGQNVGLTLRA